MATPPGFAFSRFLKFWRGVHNLSQEALADKLDSSPRHISRLENGNSRPSESMVQDIATVLHLGERDTNHLLLSAGFASAASKLDFYSPQLKWLRKAMTLSLRALDPYPTSLFDHSSKLLMVNRGWVGLYRRSVPAKTLNAATNHYEFMFNRLIATASSADWQDTVSVILMSLQQGALFSDDATDLGLCSHLSAHPAVPADWAQRAAALEPMASFRVQMEINGSFSRFYSVSSSVGAMGPTAYASEPRLTINTLYPEDDTLDLSPLGAGKLSHPLLMY